MKMKDINTPGVRKTRSLAALMDMVDRWRRLESRSMEGSVFSMSKCATAGCQTETHSSPFCLACLLEIEGTLKEIKPK